MTAKDSGGSVADARQLVIDQAARPNVILSGWGGFPKVECRTTRPRNEDDLRTTIAEGSVIARGNGRAYGDSSLSRRNTVDMRAFNRMLAFDAEAGQLTAEAGVILGDIIAAFLPRGFFPAVTPGTKFVTVGGMIAADVHGKNHHKEGSFGAFVDWIDLMTAEGRTTRCSRDTETELFEWTIGGMGLTGIILRAAFRLRPVATGWIRQEVVPAPDFNSTLAILDALDDVTYSVAWIDGFASGAGFGRSLVLAGEHATIDELPPQRRSEPFKTPKRRLFAVPFDVPSFVLNNLTAAAFNKAVYHKGRRQAGRSLVAWESFFYPLDSILGWNRVYGRRGLMQFHCVIPLELSRQGLQGLLAETAKAHRRPYLAVLKRLGHQTSRFSFPMAGHSLSLDFPCGEEGLELMQRLDRIVLQHGGRFYLAKDARLSPETLRKADARAETYKALRIKERMAGRFASAQSERLEL